MSAARESMIDGNARPTGLGVGARRFGFTLIELLVVITVIAVLAAFTITALKQVGKTKKINVAQGEMKELEIAIENYKAKYGVYPPGNASNTFSAALYSPLYYELTGVSFTDAGHSTYSTVSSNILVSQVANLFNVSGILNCTKGSGEDAVQSENFLPGLRANRVQLVTDNGWSGQMLTTSVGGPDDAYQPVQMLGINVFRYKQPDPTNNNPGSYDLWINLSISATNFPPPTPAFSDPTKLYLICNWTKSYSGGSTMP